MYSKLSDFSTQEASKSCKQHYKINHFLVQKDDNYHYTVASVAVLASSYHVLGNFSSLFKIVCDLHLIYIKLAHLKDFNYFFLIDIILR